MATSNPELFFSREELLRLAIITGARTVIGMEISPDEHVSVKLRKKEIDIRLSDLGLLKGKKISAGQLDMVQTLFQPERALIVVRDRPKIGKQILIFLCRQKQCLLHSFPKQGQHRIVETNPDAIEIMLKEWFPAQADVVSNEVSLAEAQLNELITITNNWKMPPPIPNIDFETSNKLIQSLQTRQWSAAMLLLEIQNGQALSADSFTAWRGDEKVWTANQVGPDGRLRILCGGDYFIGLRRGIVRRFAQFEKNIRAYKLSSEELALVLSLLNRGDLANRILQRISSQTTNESLQIAARSLQARGLSRLSPRGFPCLASDFEQALAPMIFHTCIGRLKTVSPQGNSEGALYLMKDRFFCAHFARNNTNVLESGPWSQLPVYLLSLFKDFGKHKMTLSKTASISLQEITTLIEETDPLTIENRLRSYGLPIDLSTSLAMDISHSAFRVSIIGINTPHKAPRENTGDHPMLFLLKGSKQDWLFSFPNERADTIGHVMQADRRRLMTELTANLNLIS